MIIRGGSMPAAARVYRAYLSAFLLCITLLLLPGQLKADTTGLIGGIVADEDGNPLVGATVLIEGTSIGTMTDRNGDYVIAGMPPGTYTVAARMVGRATARVEEVTVQADGFSRIDFALEEDPSGSTVITVEESRGHVLQDVPATVYSLDIRQPGFMSSGNIVDIVSTQPGVVYSGGELHVRGGRRGEVDYVFDGISIRSPIGNTLNFELPMDAISDAALMTGGLGVEYGNSMSGVVNMVGVEGGDEFEGSANLTYGDLTTTNLQSAKHPFMEETDADPCRRGLTAIEGSISGPEPLTEFLLPAIGLRLPGEFRFSAAGRFSASGRDSTDTRDRWDNNWQADASGLVKITYRPQARTSIGISLLGSYKEYGWNQWDWSRFHLPAYIEGEAYLGRSQDLALPVRFGETSGIIVNATQLFGSETCLNLTLGYTKFQNWHRIRSEQGGYLGDGMYPLYWLTEYDPEERIADSLGFYHTGVHPNVWYDSKASVNSIMLDLDSNPNTRVRIKAGISSESYELYQYNVYAESFFNVYISQWNASPSTGSAYLQGSYRFTGGVISTIGIRADMFDANSYCFDPQTESTVPVETKWHLSPRLGISVPFSENSVFFATYGHHIQNPPMECLYTQTDYNQSENRIVVGNPDLDPEMTQMVEVGTRYYFDRITEFSISLYLKDITGLINTEDHYEGTYYIFTNDDSHGSVRGLEVTLSRKAGSNISGQLSYSLSVAKGRYSSILDRYNYAQMGVVFISNEDNYLDWDQTHTAGASVVLTSFEDEGPSIAGLYPFENTSLGISCRYGSGIPYSLPPVSGELIEINTERYPFSMQTDLTLSRNFYLGPAELNISAGVFNLFNRHNIVEIYDTALYRSTGEPGGIMENARSWSPARHFVLSAGVKW
jgi:hypothetical protein